MAPPLTHANKSKKALSVCFPLMHKHTIIECMHTHKSLPISMSVFNSNHGHSLSSTLKDVVRQQYSLARHPTLLSTDNSDLLICSHQNAARLCIWSPCQPMSDASFHFSEKRGGGNAHRLENSPENLSAAVAVESKTGKNTCFLQCTLWAFYF